MKINELIKELCPNGVEWKNTIDLSEKSFWLMPSTPSFIDKGVPYITSKNIKDGCIIFDNVSYISKEVYAELSKNRAIQRGDLLITMIGTIGEAAFVSEDIDFYGQNLYLVRLNKEKINPNYFFYYFQTQKGKIISKKNPAGQGYIKAESINSLKIPLPPLAIQSRIVEILDNFTNLIANLTAELALRRKQFEYYREKLLSLDGVENVELKTLGSVISDLRTGLNPRVHFKLNTNDAQGYYITVRELVGFDFVVDEKTDRINANAIVRINERSRLKIGDVLFSGTGTIGRTALIKELPTYYNIKEGVYAITPKAEIIDSRFLIYLLHTDFIVDMINSKAGGSTVRSIPMAELKNINIPVPPLTTQQSIVSILDKFTALIENIETELSLRQKQYEYYREQLLTFKS